MEQSKDYGQLSAILFFVPFLLVSFGLTFLLFLFVAGVYTLTPLTDSVLPSTAFVITIVIIALVSYFAGRFGATPGWFSGGIFGLLYTLILSIAGMCSGDIAVFSLKTLLILLTGFLIGSFGGIMGINTRPRKHRRGYYIS